MDAAKSRILELLDQGGELTGLDLVLRSDGHLRRGTIYVHLTQLEEGGHVTSRLVDEQRRAYRRVYGGARDTIGSPALEPSIA